MYGEDFIERQEQDKAEAALLAAVRLCKANVPRDRLQRILEWHSRLAAKGAHTGDTDHLGADYRPREYF